MVGSLKGSGQLRQVWEGDTFLFVCLLACCLSVCLASSWGINVEGAGETRTIQGVGPAACG